MTKTELFERLINGNTPADRAVFRPILMHFAARFAGKTYGEFASDYKTLVACNLKAMEHFDLDMVGLISDPYRETSAFGAKVSFPAEYVPVCEEIIVSSIEDAKAVDGEKKSLKKKKPSALKISADEKMTFRQLSECS